MKKPYLYPMIEGSPEELEDSYYDLKDINPFTTEQEEVQVEEIAPEPIGDFARLLGNSIASAQAEEQPQAIQAPISEPATVELGDAEVEAAQDKANKTRNFALLLQAANTIGAGAAAKSGAKVDPRSLVLDTIYKDADQQVKDITDRRASQAKKVDLQALIGENDPNSPISQATRQTALRVLPELANTPGFERTSAKALKQILPWGQVIEAANGRRDQARIQAEQRKQSDAERKEQKAEAAKEKDYEKARTFVTTVANDIITAKSPRAKGLLQSRNRVDQANAVMALFSDPSIIKDKTAALAAATGLASMISGGYAPGQSAIKTLVPESLWGDTNKISTYITSNPKEVMSKAQKLNILKEVTRERDYWKTRMIRDLEATHKNLNPYFKNHPELEANFKDSIGTILNQSDDENVGQMKQRLQNTDYGYLVENMGIPMITITRPDGTGSVQKPKGLLDPEAIKRLKAKGYKVTE